jgi:protein O-mannosyl-transferase
MAAANKRNKASGSQPFAQHTTRAGNRVKRGAAPGNLQPFAGEIWRAALLLCVTIIIYLPALNGGLVWDDENYVTKPVLQSLHGLWRIWSEPGAERIQYYPLLYTAFWLEHRLWGDAVLGYHLLNVLLHAGAALLIVAVVRRLALPGAWLAAFLFALHPVCVEAVAWISEQKSTLSIVFYLAAALVYLNFDETRRRSQYFLALLLFVMALLSKSVTATLPAALLVVFWWKRGRLSWGRDILPLVPWFATGATAGLLTAWVERKFIGAEGAEYALTLAQHSLLASRVIWFYLLKLAWPFPLTFIYPRWTVDPSVWWQWLFPASLLALIAILVLTVRFRRGPLAGFLVFSGTLFPVLGFFNVYPFRFAYVADHFQYLATLGVFVPIASGLMTTFHATKGHRRPSQAAAGLVLVLLAILSFRQSGHYADAETLYRLTLADNPACWMAHNNLGVILATTPRGLGEAVAQYEAALRIKPDYAEAHTDLGNALLQIPGRESEALFHFRAAVRFNPNTAAMHYNLANALAKGHERDAIAEYQDALRIEPNWAEAHMNLGLVLAQLPGRLPEAIREEQAALQIRPNWAAARVNLGMALSRDPQRFPEAIAELRAAELIEPDSAEVHYRLAILLSRMADRLPEAIEQYQAALRIQPQYADAHTMLGMTLAKLPQRLPEAIAEFQAAVRLQPQSPQAHSNLAIALSMTPGGIAQAIAEFETSYRISPDPAIRQTLEHLRARSAAAAGGETPVQRAVSGQESRDKRAAP